MLRKNTAIVAALTVLLLGLTSATTSADEALDKAFDALNTYDWGNDRSTLSAIDTAVAASHDDAGARRELEKRLAAVLSAKAPRAAKDFACRKLSLVGTVEAVPTLQSLLADKELSHMARYALERMTCPESATAMRDSLPKVGGLLKVGVINSLGVRRDAESVSGLVGLLGDSDPAIAGAAAAALGAIGNAEAAKALGDFQEKAPETLRLTVADACLVCAEHLLADGKKVQAMAIYKSLVKPDQPKHVRLAATRGLLAVTGTK